MSLKQLTKAGCRVVFEENFFEVFKDGERMLSGELDETGLYAVLDHISSEEKIEALTSTTKQTLDDWHKRLGHMSIKQIEFLAKNNLVKNLKIDNDATHSINCKTCDAAKLPRKKFAKFKERATTHLQE